MGYNKNMDEEKKHIKVTTEEDVKASLASRVEAFLFAEGGSLTLRRLAHLAGVIPEDLAPALDLLAERLADTGLTLICTDNEVSLAVAPGPSESLRESYEKDMGREIGDAGLEVLGILLYKGPSTRAQIDYIRGVNTSSTVRTLLSRGLIERSGNPNDGREYVYRPTVELLAHLGLTHSAELPEYAKIINELAEFEAKREPADAESFGEARPFNNENHGESDDTLSDAD